jgi:amino acid permease
MASDTSSIDLELEAELIKRKKGSWAKRTFSPMVAGSMRGSIFTLGLSAIGAGKFHSECLFIPILFMEAGFILGAFILLSCGLVSLYSLNILVEASDQHNIYYMPQLIEHLLGRTPALICESLIILYEFGIIIGLQVVVGELTPVIVDEMGLSHSHTVVRIITMIVFNWTVMLPLSLYKKLGSLIWVSFFGFAGLCYVGICILVEFPFFISSHGFEGVVYFKMDWAVLSVVTICLMNYFCHTNLAKLQGELSGSSVQRMKKITGRTIIMLASVYIILGLFGYLSTLANTPIVIVNRDAPDTIGSDWAMVLGRVFITVTLISAVPVNLNPCRTAIIHMLFNGDPSDRL